MRQRRGVRLAVGTVVVLFAGALPQPAAAGEIALEGHAGYFQMTASNTGSAMFGSDSGGTFGGALRESFWRGAFVTAGARTFSKTGERVFVAAPASPVQKLGFPLTMRTTPIFLQLGYRFGDGHLIVPYLAAGGTLTLYKETSEVAGESFDKSASKAGFLGSVGVEVGRGAVRFAAEGGWSTVPSAIGTGGVSQVYDEKDIGGKYVIGKIVLAFSLDD
jgi:hypothetical protein